MSRTVFGLQARFLLAMGLAFVLVSAILALLLERQATMQREVGAVSGNVVRGLFERSVRSRGESLSAELADSLANPLYYSDLDTIGVLARNTARQQVVSYVKVFDAEGRLVHDGSEEIADYGQPMRDPLAAKAVAARDMVVQESADVLEVARPIMIGRERLGGVRVGMSMERVRQLETDANLNLTARLREMGRRHLGWLVLLLAGLVVTAAAVAVYIERTLVKPIRWLAAAARQIEAGHYDIGAPKGRRNDEMGELIEAFGRMSQGIARHDREIRHMAYTDALTGLTNRLAFREALDHRLIGTLGTSRQLALLFADIDDFKRINDTLGHEAGDQALVQFAGRIIRAVEQIDEQDPMLARFGGDEFVILIQDGDVAQAATRLADVLVEEMARPLVIQDREVFLGISIGITLYPDDGADATTLLKNGDIAMYQAKMAGKNCYRFYSRAMDHAVERRMHMEYELRNAWARGEIHLVYQPIFRIADRRMVGVETLMRWQHPQLGAIAPAVFIEIAEQTGLIETIGPKVLEAACHEAMGWPVPAGGEPLFVAVNVAPRQLRTSDLDRVVTRVLDESGLPASRLHLELTETAVLGDELQASSLMAKLHRTGVTVWLDDFGTGFSGLNHLRQVPVDGVKIDKSFVADMQRDPDDLALTGAVISMAHSLGITVVAEGIEQEAQLQLLRERGCELGQGYLFSHPLSSEDLVRRLRSQA